MSQPIIPPKQWYGYGKPKSDTDEIIERLVRIETRLVKLMLASGLDADGKRVDPKETMPG